MDTNTESPDILKAISRLENIAINEESKHVDLLSKVKPVHKLSAKNLINYLAFRSIDLRELQQHLSEMSISSLSHAESHIIGSLDNVRQILAKLTNNSVAPVTIDHIGTKASKELIKKKSESLFGQIDFPGQSKIMVTLPTEAADDYKLVYTMIKSGMNIARINTAHDSKKEWKQMIENVKKAAKKLERDVKIYMDLEGPKLRIGEIIETKKTLKKDKKNNSFIQVFKNSLVCLVNDATNINKFENGVVKLESPEVFGHIKAGEKVWIDDGKIGGVVTEADKHKIIIKITIAPEEGCKLKKEKGVAFPDNRLPIPAITQKDLKHLPFITRHADMVGLSFVQSPSDIDLLQQKLKSLKATNLGIILKIETSEAFNNLPNLLLTAMRSKNCGIMIARGDLAVAIGYTRIAEVQEEILWLAEAAHLPVIWATQVLETQAKKGVATRAEISDAVKSVRAECVMLNKGPYILEAIKTIRDINKRMVAHEDKKLKLNRSLNVAKHFIEE